MPFMEQNIMQIKNVYNILFYLNRVSTTAKVLLTDLNELK